MSYPRNRITDFHPYRKIQRHPRLESIKDEMPFFTHSTVSANFLAAPSAPTRKRTEQIQRPRDEVDDFLSSDLELSFASTMSLHSPPRDPIELAQDSPQPMDISPAPKQVFTRPPPRESENLKLATRPRAFTSATRTFGLDSTTKVLNLPPLPKSGSSYSQAKRTQRAALPTEWLASPAPTEHWPITGDTQNIQPPSSPGDDDMDIDSFVLGSSAPSISSGPLSAAPTITAFNAFFYESMSPSRRAHSPDATQSKKRRSVSPEPSNVNEHDVSSPAPPSSPSVQKLERKASGPLLAHFSKPSLQGLGEPPSNLYKRVRRPAFSAMVHPSDAAPLSAFPILSTQGEQPESPAFPPARRAFSALLPMSIEPSSDESSFDGPDMSSPAQAYARRQQVKTIRRCDGTDDFRPLTGASAMVARESPSHKFLSPGLPSFGDNEAHGKILPCHRVREDGLMRIKAQTLDNLLDGHFDSKIADFHVIDCRFDYEYNGGHIPGAVNINTTAGVEDFLLGTVMSKPRPSTSGDSAKKTILVFHCEFSVKRAPTFAKHLRSKDRAMNNHVYPKIHYPEMYILEGGYCQYFKASARRCQPSAYVTMDDPAFAASRKEDLDQFRKAKFGRTKSYAYGDLAGKMAAISQQQQQKRNTAPSGTVNPLFAAANAARTRRGGALSTLAEDGNTTAHSDDEDTDIGDSPCPPPTKNAAMFKGKKLGRASLQRAETYGPARMAY